MKDSACLVLERPVGICICSHNPQIESDLFVFPIDDKGICNEKDVVFYNQNSPNSPIRLLDEIFDEEFQGYSSQMDIVDFDGVYFDLQTIDTKIKTISVVSSLYLHSYPQSLTLSKIDNPHVRLIEWYNGKLQETLFPLSFSSNKSIAAEICILCRKDNYWMFRLSYYPFFSQEEMLEHYLCR